MSVRDRDDLVVARLHQLAPHLDGEPDPAWQATTRARLVAMAAVRSPAPEPVSPWRRFLSRAEDAAPSRWRGRLTAGLAGAAMAVTAMATLVAVSTDAGPGDPLYGLKRGTEETQLALAGDGRGQTLLDFARTRLHELEELTGSGVSALPAAGGAGPDGTVGPGRRRRPGAGARDPGDHGRPDHRGRRLADRPGGRHRRRRVAGPARRVERGPGRGPHRAARGAAGLHRRRARRFAGPAGRDRDPHRRPVRRARLRERRARRVDRPVRPGARPLPPGGRPELLRSPAARATPARRPSPGQGSESTGTAAVPTQGAPSGGTSTGGPQQSGGGEGEGDGGRADRRGAERRQRAERARCRPCRPCRCRASASGSPARAARRAPARRPARGPRPACPSSWRSACPRSSW